MSGIIGVYSVDGENVFNELSHGTIALQHRGDRGFGFAMAKNDSDPKNWFIHESRRGLVFYDLGSGYIKDLEEADSHVGIGHTLYEKSGGLQPRGGFTENGYDFMMAMDGVLLGYPARDEIVMKQLVSDALTETDNFFQAGEVIMEDLDGRGPYNVVMNVRNYNNGEYYLVAFRDPKGIKPLCIGKTTDNKYIVASETKAFQNMDTKYVTDVEPGSMMVVSKGGITHKKIVSQPHAHCAFEWIYFASTVSDIEGKNVYLVRKRLGEALANMYPEVEMDQVICSPDSGRSVALGFQHAITRRNLDGILKDVENIKSKGEILKYLESNLHKAFVPFEEAVEKNPTAPRTFQIEDPVLRELAAQTKFYFNKDILEGKTSGTGDDSIVRGSVFKDGMVPKANECGSKRFGAIISCPPLSHACVKDPGGKTFAAQGMKGNVEEIGKSVAKNLGLDFVLYPTGKELDNAIGLKDTCKACFNGKYPVNDEFVPDDQKG